MVEDRFIALEEMILNDPMKFVKEELWPLSLSFDRQKGEYNLLIDELKQLIQREPPFTDNTIAVVDEWTIKIFAKEGFSTVNNSRELLIYILAAFEDDDAFGWLAERFNCSKEVLLETAGSEIIFEWLLLWLHLYYPNLKLFLFGLKFHKAIKWLEHTPLKQVILYLPKFMLWGYPKSLNVAQKRFVARKLAEGLSLRKIKPLPFPFSKKMAHFFTNAPKHLDYDQAVQYAFVKSLGGNDELLGVLQNRFYNWDCRIDFIKNVVTLFQRIGMPDNTMNWDSVMGFLQHLWDETGCLPTKGWTLQSFKRRLEDYYNDINRLMQANHYHPNGYTYQQYTTEQRWGGANYAPFEFVDDEQENYQIVQLTTGKALEKEGLFMHHCVGSYIWKCVEYGTSIWSLRLVGDEHFERLVTIEISIEHQIVQARGKMNAEPKAAHWDVIKRWARREGIKI